MGFKLFEKKSSSFKQFEELASSVYEDLYRYIYSICRNRNLSEDALQETMINAYRHFNDIRDIAKFRQWIFTIGRREAINIVRRNSREISVEVELLELHNESGFYIPDDWLEKSEIKTLLVGVINSLKPRYRDLLIMYYYSDLSLEEIAEVLNTNINTVKTWHSRAKASICKKLQELGENCERGII